MPDSDRFRIDSHKLHLHPQRVADWLDGKNIAPLYVEISPSGACNHRCRFCGLDFMGYQPHFLPADIMRRRLKEMGEAGVKAVMFAGEGEPFLHQDMAELALATKTAGMDVAFTTNAVLLNPDVARRVLPVTSWIKVSCNAGSAETYAAIHGTKAHDFTTVMENMTEAVRLRATLQSSCTLGFQMVLLPENVHEAVELAERVRDLGADYLVIKPYAVHRQSHKTSYLQLNYEEMPQVASALEALCTGSFRVIWRHDTFHRRVEAAAADARCMALPFWGYIDSQGMLWGCLRHLGEEAFAYGNIIAAPVAEVLHGDARRQRMAWCSAHLDISECHAGCRMDAINRYLWELKSPSPHVNFI